MRKLIIFLLLITAISSCKENERLLYDLNSHDIYFRDVNENRDSLYVSLLTKEAISITTVPIRILGNKPSSPLKFKVEVVKEKTTAIEGVHYKKLPEFFEFPADLFVYQMPIEIIKGDESIKTKAANLTLRLVGSEELGVAYSNRSTVRLVIADMLKVPEGTGYYGDMTAFRTLFGEYSKVKHLMIIDIVGHDFWDKGSDIFNASDYYRPYARRLYNIITTGEYKDENGKLITGWNVP